MVRPVNPKASQNAKIARDCRAKHGEGSMALCQPCVMTLHVLMVGEIGLCMDESQANLAWSAPIPEYYMRSQRIGEKTMHSRRMRDER